MGDIYTNSMFKDWKLCRRKYYYKYLKKIMLPQKDENFELGKKVHALVSYKLNGFDTSIIEKSADEEVLEHYYSILKHPILKQQPFLVEWGFVANIEDSQDILSGRIDAVFYNPETKKYTIVDWKTGMKIPNIPLMETQAQIYLYAFYKARKDLGIEIKPEDVSFLFIKTPDLKESGIEFSSALYDRFEQDFTAIVKEINSYQYFEDAFEEKASCKFCEYKFICQKN